VRDCALVVLSTGISAADLREFREALLRVEESSIYHHLWGRLLQPQFDEPEYNNDFAAWAFHSLNDRKLAEQLSAVDPSEFVELSELRNALVDIVELRMDERDAVSWNQAQEAFYFTSAQAVVFDAKVSAATPRELAALVPQFSNGSVFYHFIEARRRPPFGTDDLSNWLENFGPEFAALGQELRSLDPYFSSLQQTKHLLTSLFARLEESNA
jgi:hypothetical protein